MNEVKWLRGSRNCVWPCDICIKNHFLTTDAKFASVVETFKNETLNVKKNRYEIVKLLERFRNNLHSQELQFC